MIICPTSLTATVEHAGEAFLYQQPINQIQSEEISSLLVVRQVQSGSNTAFFLPFASEKETQSRLLTGEPLHTDFAYRHIQLIEAARLLLLLAGDTIAVQRSISLAEKRMATSCFSKFCAKGECKAITIAYMRYLACSVGEDSEAQQAHFLTRLSDFRNGRGRWRGFPYFYTLLMLIEVDQPLAGRELQYAAPTCAKLLDHVDDSDRFSRRRQLILNKVLSRN